MNVSRVFRLVAKESGIGFRYAKKSALKLAIMHKEKIKNSIYPIIALTYFCGFRIIIIITFK